MNSPRRLYCPCGNFHQKTCLNKFQDNLLWIVKDTRDEIIEHVEKIMLFYQRRLKMVDYEKFANIPLSVLKKGQAWCFQIWDNWQFLYCFWNEKKKSLLILDTWGKSNLLKSALFCREMVGFTYFGLDISLWYSVFFS